MFCEEILADYIVRCTWIDVKRIMLLCDVKVISFLSGICITVSLIDVLASAALNYAPTEKQVIYFSS